MGQGGAGGARPTGRYIDQLDHPIDPAHSRISPEHCKVTVLFTSSSAFATLSFAALTTLTCSDTAAIRIETPTILGTSMPTWVLEISNFQRYVVITCHTNLKQVVLACGI